MFVFCPWKSEGASSTKISTGVNEECESAVGHDPVLGNIKEMSSNLVGRVMLLVPSRLTEGLVLFYVLSMVEERVRKNNTLSLYIYTYKYIHHLCSVVSPCLFAFDDLSKSPHPHV